MTSNFRLYSSIAASAAVFSARQSSCLSVSLLHRKHTVQFKDMTHMSTQMYGERAALIGYNTAGRAKWV
jgi:hypothetical protein